MTTQLIEVETGRVVVPQIVVARSIVQRTIGLIGKSKLAPTSGFWLEPCNGIHTFGMRFALDVVAFDASGKILKTWVNVRPYRICLPVAQGRTVLELTAGTLAHLSLQQNCHYRIDTAKSKRNSAE